MLREKKIYIYISCLNTNLLVSPPDDYESLFGVGLGKRTFCSYASVEMHVKLQTTQLFFHWTSGHYPQNDSEHWHD